MPYAMVTCSMCMSRTTRFMTSMGQRKFQLVGAVGGVQVDQDEAGLGAGELSQRPFTAVGSPDPDAIVGCQPQGEKGGGQGVDTLFEFAVSPADILVPHDEGSVRAPFCCCCVEGLPDRFKPQRH